MNKKLRRLLEICFVLAGIVFVFWAVIKGEEIPSVEEGHSRVIYDAEDYARSNLIIENADATGEYIFLNHGRIISAFDWSGSYCFSIVTTARGNGVTHLYCYGDTLWVIDRNYHVFIYDGPMLTQDFQIESPVNSTLESELREKENRLITLSGNKVLGPEGTEILTVAGVQRSRLSPAESAVVLAAFALVFFGILWLVWKECKKNRSSGEFRLR